MVDRDRIELDDLPPHIGGVSPPPSPAADAESPMRRLAGEIEARERRRIAEALRRTDGVKFRAAAILGMPIWTST
ncbi:MAG TPA: helix-turn-helix domain-containing protein [Kofleriaceae bacterium]|nr:helix-turn-helix domain-containing protein [Kofleriaceae bacterium]